MTKRTDEQNDNHFLGYLVLVFAVIGAGVMLEYKKAWSQPAPQPEAVYSLSVTATEANVIGGALATLPFKDVAPLMTKLQKQITEQEAAAKDVKPKGSVEDPKKP